jgi:uncharacterized protein YndB with AHSA1/START domain
VIGSFSVSTTVEAPPSEVYEFLDVLANHERFLDHFLVDWRFSGPARGLGARARARTDAPGGQDWSDFEVIEVEAGRRIVEDGVGANGKRHTRGTYLLTETAGGGTEIEFELEWLQASRAERLAPPLIRAFLRRSNAKAMRRLAKLLAD